MNHQQAVLLDNHKKSLAMWVDSKGITVRKNWRQSHKNKKIGDYLVETFNRFWLSKEQREALEQDEYRLAEKYERKSRSKSNFLAQLKRMMEYFNKKEDTFQNFVNLYLLNSKSSDKKKTQLSSVEHYDVNEQEVRMVEKEFTSGGKIIFIHDPLVGKSCQVHMVSSDLALFTLLQEAIDTLYETFNIAYKLPFYIQIDDSQKPLYKVVIDFSGYPFDTFDRKQLLSAIGDYFKVDLNLLLDKEYFPSVITMDKILSEIARCLPSSLAKKFSILDRSLSRDECEKIFKRNINLLQKNYKALNSRMQTITHALFHFQQEWHYQDISGKPCKTHPPVVNSLDCLLENEKKRRTLELISKQMEVFENKSLTDSLLFRQQKECLIELCMNIARFYPNKQLETIYQDWKNQTLQYLHQSITTVTLMKMRLEKNSFFGKAQSPDVWYVCQQIEELLANPEVHSIELNVSTLDSKEFHVSQ